jgi:hypothetical protein
MPWPSERRPSVSASPALQRVVEGCRACARACRELLDQDEDPGDEAQAIIGDCALTCTAIVDLSRAGARFAIAPALTSCAEDCRAAAAACVERRWDARWSACELACRRCADECEAAAKAAGERRAPSA